MRTIGQEQHKALGSILLILLAITCAQNTQAIIINPQHTILSNYDTPQVFVITFYNDGFQPIRLSLTPTSQSEYLAEYVTIEEDTTILQAQEQANIKITTNFPSNLPPQIHRFEFSPTPTSTQVASIQIRPPGEAVLGLRIEEFSHTSNEQGTLLMNLTLVNYGNVYLQVTPHILIEGPTRKDVIYPQSLHIAPRQRYPLSLRQETTELDKGDYQVRVSAQYQVDEHTGRTQEETYNYTKLEDEKTQNTNWQSIITIAITAAIVVMAILWLAPKRKHTTKRHKEIRHMRQEVRALEQETHNIATHTKKLIEELHKHKR